MSYVNIELQKLIMKIIQLSQMLTLTLPFRLLILILPNHLIKTGVQILIKVTKKQSLCSVQRLQLLFKLIPLLKNLRVFNKTFQKVIFLIQRLKNFHLNLRVELLDQKLTNNLRDLIP